MCKAKLVWHNNAMDLRGKCLTIRKIFAKEKYCSLFFRITSDNEKKVLRH